MRTADLQRAKLNAQYTRQIADAVERRSRIALQNPGADGSPTQSFSNPGSAGIPAGETPNAPHSTTLALAAAEPPAFPCPTGDCPPPTVNILCQPHPDFGQFPNKVIIKFSSLDEKTVNAFGVTRQFVSGLGLTDALGIGQSVAGNIRRGIDPLIPRADPGLLGQQQAQEINNGITQFLNNFESTFAQIIRQSIAPFLGNGNSVYDKILEIAYSGVPCPDATVKLTGTFSHAAVSTALSATGGVVLSTTGAAGVVGSINLLGVPVGRTESYVAGTDNRGDPNPSFCGESLFAIGPIEFGQMKSKFECPGCVTGMLGAFGQLTGCLADATIRAILSHVAPQHLNKTTQQALAALTDPEKLAFIGQIFSMPPVPGFGDCFAAAVRSAVDSFNPSFTLCGAVVPKLFGIPLSAELVEVNAAATRTNIAARFAFSPSFVINNLMLCAGSAGLFCQPIFPALDNASMGFGLGFPDFAEAVVGGFEGKFNSPAAIANFAKDGFDNMLANATYTIGYEINPFGFKLASAEARVILPNLTEHPARPGFNYVRPEDRGQNFPSRLNVALTALESGFLANPLWKGTAQDLPTIFPQGSAERTKLQQTGLSFQKDYFPHGGILGAARLALPKLIVDAPPATLNTVLDPSQDVFARLGAAADVIGNFLLQTSEVGSLAFYVPAPNPPFFTDGAGKALTPPRILEAIQTFDVSKIGLQSLYPLEQFFFSGYMEGRLVGVPIARADIVAVPASASSGAFFRVSSSVPGNSWLKSFVDSANMTFEIRQSPPQPIEVVFQDLMDDVIALNRPGSKQADVANLVNQISTKLTDGLPKVSLDIFVNNFRVPDPLTNLLTSASTSVRLVAYSPRFNPNFPGTGPLAEVTRRGGIAFKSRFNFANLVTIDNAELAVFPSDIASLPNLSGRFSVPQLGFPKMALKNAIFDFNSIPAAGAPFLAASGTIDPILINNPLNGGRLMSIVPLAASASVINAKLSMIRAANNSIQGSFSIDPARIDMPMFGNGLTARIHGATTNDPFSFSTTGPWNASASIVGQLSLRDPAGAEIVRIGSSGGNFSASASGNGFALSSLIVSNIPTGLTITSYPGTAFTQSFTIGGTTPAQLRVNGDGTFSFTAELGGALNLPGLPAPALRAGASITINERQLQFTGSFEGGLLAAGVSAQGTFTLSGGGIPTLTGSATIPPQPFGLILIRGVSTDNLTVQLFHDGYAVGNGARLQVTGVNSDLLTLSPFTNRANQNFTATVTTGSFSVPNHFQMASSQMKFQRVAGVVSLEINSPTLTLMPGSQNQTVLTAPFPKVIVGTDGRFYADSGVKAINLLGGLKLQGRLEIGNEPSAAVPGLTIAPLKVDYGAINFGTISNKTVRFSNTGDAPLIVNLSSSSSSFIPAQSDLSIPVGEFRDVGLQFRPTASGVNTGQIQVFMAPGGQQPPLTLTGEARPVPIFDVNATSLSFGDVPVGTPRTRTLVVRNLGVAPLVLTSGALTGPFTISPAISKRALQPGERADFTLTFTPTALGAASGTLTIPASDSPTPHSIDLQTGNAYAERMVRLREGGPTLRSIAMISTNTGWAVGDDGAFLRTDNGGRSWLTVRAPFSGSFRAVAARNSLVVVAGLDGMAGVSTDAGLSWRRLSSLPVTAPTNHWTSIALVPLSVPAIGNLSSVSKVMLAGFNDAGGGVILREEAGAFALALAAASPINAIAGNLFSPTLPSRVIAVGDSGIVVRSTDAGVTWTTTTLQGGFTHLRGVAFGGSNAIDTVPDVWIVGDSGSLFTAASLSGTFGRVFGPTLENFNAVRVGYLVGDNGSAYSRLPILANPPMVRDNPTGAYDFTALSGNDAGTLITGQFGQIYFRPNTAPAGPFITFAPGEADFGLLPLGRTRSIEVRVFNRGFTSLNVSGIALTGSSAFSVSATTLLTIATNSSKTFLVRFTPGTQGDHTGVIEFTHNESATKYRLPLRGRGQVNTWNLLASPTTESLRDVQFVSDSTGFASSLGHVFKTTNGGTNWTQTSAAPPGNISRIHFFSSTLGFAFGGEAGRLFPTCTGTCASYILRTADGGTTWSSRNSSVTTAVDDLHMVSSTTGFAVTRSTLRRLGIKTPGDVLRTTDGGLTWAVRTRPEPLSGVFSGSAVHAVSSSAVFASGNGELHRSTDGGQTWTRVLNLGSIIEDIQFLDANNGWIVGQDGAFRRTTTGGTVSTAWTPQPSFTGIDLRRVHFINLNTGWTAGFDGTAGGIFRTDNGGTTWVQEFQENLSAGAAGPSSVSGRSTSVAFAVNHDGVYKSGIFNPALQGSPVLPSLVDFGVVSFGVNASSSITLRNAGATAVNVTSLALDDDDDTGAFDLQTTLPISVPASGSLQISVRYRPSTVARHHATLLLATDGYEGTLRCDLVGEAQVFPTTLVFETDPPGLNIKLDQFTARGPRSVTVVGEPKVPNDVINPFEWRFGTTHTVTAPATQVSSGFDYRFQRWEPSQPEVFTILATNVPATYRAVYVQAKTVEPAVGGAIPGHRSNRAIGLQGLHAAGGPPSDIPSGPYIRISQAELQLPALGNVGVQGSAFLSSDRFSLALASDPIGNPQLLSVDAGSWLVSFTNNVRFVLRAQNPAITLLNRPATASSQVLFDVSATRIVAQLNLSSSATTPIIPSVVELGPGTTVAFTNAVSGVARFSSFRTTGDLRLLAKPGGGFAITQPFNFRASDGPFTNSITSFPTTILDTPLLRITPAASPKIEIRRDGNGVFGVLVNNFNLSLLGGANTLVSGSVVGTKMNFSAGNTIALGSLQYNAQSPSSLEWGFSGPSFRVTVAPGTLTVPGISQGLSFGSGLTIDTDASFSKKITLPALTFDGIGVNGGGPLEHNFLRFFREDGVAGFELRDRRSFFDNTFKLAININSAGQASGTFKGNLVIKDFLGCDEIGIPDLRLTYNSGFDDFQFRDDVSLETCLLGRHDFRVRFGTSGAKFCHLICGPTGCAEDLCFP